MHRNLLTYTYLLTLCIFYRLAYLTEWSVKTGSCTVDLTVTDYGMLFWPRTTHSHQAVLNCPYGGDTPTARSAIARRWCNVSDNGVVEWTQPDYNQCSTVTFLIQGRV